MRRSLSLLASLLFSLALFAAPPPSPHRIGAPRVTVAPVIDGEINAREWQGAVRVQLSGNLGNALLMHDDNYLYVGIEGAKAGSGSICVRGKTGVRVLHASAALGTAAFEPEQGKWRLTRGFTWTNRGSDDKAVALAERKKFLSTDGWFANTQYAVTTEREYQIPIRGLKEVPMTIGFFTFTRREKKFNYLAPTLEDDCADAELAGGFTDREYTFDPDQWGVVILQ